jgi:hypothetical protein
MDPTALDDIGMNVFASYGPGEASHVSGSLKAGLWAHLVAEAFAGRAAAGVGRRRHPDHRNALCSFAARCPVCYGRRIAMLRLRLRLIAACRLCWPTSPPRWTRNSR